MRSVIECRSCFVAILAVALVVAFAINDLQLLLLQLLVHVRSNCGGYFCVYFFA